MKNVFRLILGCFISVLIVDIVAYVFHLIVTVFNLYNKKEFDLIGISLVTIVSYMIGLCVVMLLMLAAKKKK